MAGKYYIAVDCEGVACAVGENGLNLGDGPNYRFAAEQATREADAAARALFDAGADEVRVWDAHHAGINLDYMALDPRCDILLGSGHRGRFCGIDESWSAVLFIGYHAMAGTEGAVLSHSYSSSTFQYMKINGEPVGELAIDAAYAGAAGVPVLFVAGDDHLVAEGKRLFGDIATVTTKQALSWTSAISRHPLAVVDAIYETVYEAAHEGPRSAPYTMPEPLELELRFQKTQQAEQYSRLDRHGKPFALVDPYTRQGELNSVLDLF